MGGKKKKITRKNMCKNHCLSFYNLYRLVISCKRAAIARHH